MFSIQRNRENTQLEDAISNCLSEMEGFTADADEYATMVARLDTLYKLKEIDKTEHVSKDTLVIVAGNLLGILLIINYEKAGIVTTNAVKFLLKPR